MTALVAYDLRCNFRTDPLGIDDRSPRLSWRLRSGVRCDRATAYRVLVYARQLGVPDDDEATVWDTGWREDEDAAVRYSGLPLASFARYRWTLELRDRRGETTAPTHGWFETALLHADDWQAAWIGRDPESAPPVDPPGDADLPVAGLLGYLNRRLPPPLHLRRDFALQRPVREARLYITARGLYLPFVNGARVGDAELAPGWTDYNRRIAYQTYDVTALLGRGANTLAAILADGWYSGRVGPAARRLGEHYGNRPELLAQLHAYHDDGSLTVVAGDGDWLASTGPRRFADLLAGEYYDARRELDDWTVPRYDASEWSPVLLRDGGREQLIASSDEPIRAVEELAPIDVSASPSGGFIVDLGQNMVGRVRLTVRAANRGRQITLRHAEILDADGNLYCDNLRLATATDTYVTAGGDAETFEPAFTFHGFRYVEINGYPAELSPDDIRGVVLHNDLPRVGSLSTSDGDTNQLLSNIWWSQRGNSVGIPTDCPQRDERLGWLADAQVFLPTACFFADCAAFFRRWLRDVIDARLPSGAFPDVAPRIVFEREGAPGWGDAGVIVPWHLWRIYGDPRILTDSFDAMAGWVDHIHRSNPDLIWRNHVGNHYGDWLQVDVETPREVLATAYFARSARLVARAAEVLGRGSDAARYGDLADRIRDAFIAAFVGADGSIDGDTQTCYLLALAFELLPPRLAHAAAARLAADIERRGNSLSTGFLGVALLCPVLSEQGRSDLAYALLHQTGYPSWLYSIRHGATTIWERWDGWTEERGFQSPAMNSFNHYAFGSIGEWLFRYVAGIDQHDDSVAHKRLLLRPTPGGSLTWVEARLETERGRVESSWRVEDETLHLRVQVPPGASATVHVPTAEPARVLESGRQVRRCDDVTIRGEESGALVCEVESGTYEFTAPAPARPDVPAPLEREARLA